MAQRVADMGGVYADAKTARRAQRRLRREMANPRMRKLERQATRRHFAEAISAAHPGDREAACLLMGTIRRLRGHLAHIALVRAALAAVLANIVGIAADFATLTVDRTPVDDLSAPISRHLVLTVPSHAPTFPVAPAGVQA